MKNNYKLYVINKETLFYNEYKRRVETGVIYKDIKSNLLKAIRRLHLKLHLPFFELWYTQEFINEKNYSKNLIIFDSLLTRPAANFLSQKKSQGRVIYWFWNHLYDPIILNDLDARIEKWSYDENDCTLYGLKFNHQFYFKELASEITSKVIKRDFFFIGVEKGRLREIAEASAMIKSEKLTKKFIIIGTDRKSRESSWVDYSTIVDYIIESKCIVDIMPLQQRGLTLRPLEALFHKKKLLTNNPYIKTYPFYSSNNIFIIGRDSGLKDFVNRPYDQTVNQFIEKYDFEDWLNSFNK